MLKREEEKGSAWSSDMGAIECSPALGWGLPGCRGWPFDGGHLGTGTEDPFPLRGGKMGQIYSCVNWY